MSPGRKFILQNTPTELQNTQNEWVPKFVSANSYSSNIIYRPCII